MSRKRKRRAERSNEKNVLNKQKKRKPSPPKGSSCADSDLQHAVLSSYYHHVVTLRSFLLSNLPEKSLAQRKKIASYGSELQKESFKESFLDETLVGILNETEPAAELCRQQDFVSFTQDPRRLTEDSNGSDAALCIGEVVDFAIWNLFNKTNAIISRPKNVLCYGYQRAIAKTCTDRTPGDAPKIPGLVMEHPNENVQTLKTAPWTDLMALIGGAGNIMIMKLLLDCGIFLRMETGRDNFYQLSGVPISDLELLKKGEVAHVRASASTTVPPKQALAGSVVPLHKPNNVVFVRHRILYARPSLNAKGNVAFGMTHVHVLSRYPDQANLQHTVHVLKYIFPRQFGLHNVFTSTVDQKTTLQPFKDYTLREQEIQSQQAKGGKEKLTANSSSSVAMKVPRRLRDGAFKLARKMQRNFKKCSYTQLLRHYCSHQSSKAFQITDKYQTSSNDSHALTQNPVSSFGRFNVTSSMRKAARLSKSSLMDYATPSAQVSAFCQATIQQILPRNAFGTGQGGESNRIVVLKWIDHFITMRRNEALNLHSVTQGIKIIVIDWLHPPKLGYGSKLSSSDRDKRWELLYEFVYYLFDSIVIPLIRSNFYVTESAVHRNRLFYFRHDIWRKIWVPSLSQLKLTMFEEAGETSNVNGLVSRTLGHSTIRLLPKANGIRIIANLKKGIPMNYKGRLILGKSINKQLEPVFDVLGYERGQTPEKLGSSMFSSNEIHGRIKNFSSRLKGHSGKLYFVKLDIKSCFDSIPQNRLIMIAETLFRNSQYRIHTHAEFKPASEGAKFVMNRRFLRTAFPEGNEPVFSKEVATCLAEDKKKVVFTDTGNLNTWKSRPLLQKLREHVQQNIVKIGNRDYRQKNGIPQGSILSSLLCSFFYGAFEAENLDFLDDCSLLLRLIDDFLLITTDETKARRFLDVMADGNSSYGISVQPHKSLTNFDASVFGRKIPRLHGTTEFPYIGFKIDTKTLAISKAREEKDPEVRNGLTVQALRAPGAGFRNKVLHSLKIQLVSMVLDTKLNSKVQVMSNLYQCFTETAMKMHQYINALGVAMRPNSVLIFNVIEECINLAFNLMRQNSKTRTKLGYECSLSKSQTTWLAAASVEAVMRRKQSRYVKVLKGLTDMRQRTESSMRVDNVTLKRIVEDGSRGFRNYIF